MAIFSGIECSVTIDGNAVPEYACPPDDDESDTSDDSDPGPVIKKYIESRADQNFGISFQLQAKFKFQGCDALSCNISIDGDYMTTPILMKRYLAKGTLTASKKGVNEVANGVSTIRRFRFSKLATDDVYGQVSVAHIKKIQHLGDIKVIIHRVKMAKPVNKFTPRRNESSVLRFSEKSTKGRAIDSFTTLDVPVPSKPAELWSSNCVDTKPWVTFFFRYRSIDALQQIGILEKPLSTRSLEDRDPASLTLEETRELIRRQRQIIQHQEDSEKLMKQQFRERTAQLNLRTLDAIKRARSPTPRNDNSDPDDEEIQIVKRVKKNTRIEVIELDD